jgi:hypothetical protein
MYLAEYPFCLHENNTVLEFLNNLCGLELSKNRVVAQARQATWAGGIDSLELILGLLKSLKIRALSVQSSAFL